MSSTRQFPFSTWIRAASENIKPEMFLQVKEEDINKKENKKKVTNTK